MNWLERTYPLALAESVDRARVQSSAGQGQGGLHGWDLCARGAGPLHGHVWPRFFSVGCGDEDEETNARPSSIGPKWLNPMIQNLAARPFPGGGKLPCWLTGTKSCLLKTANGFTRRAIVHVICTTLQAARPVDGHDFLENITVDRKPTS
jgi:hypothetical protein